MTDSRITSYKSFEEICIETRLPYCKEKNFLSTSICQLQNNHYECTETLSFSGWALITGLFIGGLIGLLLFGKLFMSMFD